MPDPAPVMRLTGPARCVIRVRGVLAPEWSARLGDMAITCVREAGSSTTRLTGRLIDQAALHGVLNALYELGFPLLSVDCVPEEDARDAGRNTAG
ncbi:MAG: hypothetical protein KC442_01360 [Thermomicrobiales bacterium]|nr:hypothetical protein [Thermomicrobiales bacterium]